MEGIEAPAGVPPRSPRTSSPSLTGYGNVNDISDHPRDRDDISQTSVDIEEDDLQESNDIQEDFSRRPNRNFKLLPKSRLVDEDSYCGPVTNRALRRYNLSDLASVKEILAVKQDIKKVNTVVDRKGNKAIMAATALRKVVVKLESALIVMSPEHQGLIAEENLDSQYD